MQRFRADTLQRLEGSLEEEGFSSVVLDLREAGAEDGDEDGEQEPAYALSNLQLGEAAKHSMRLQGTHVFAKAAKTTVHLSLPTLLCRLA